jgi:hypothetical protein
MSQIKIKILKQGKEFDKVLSCTFFTMRGAYRDFSKYIRNLEIMIENSRVLRGFETRIYTDDTGADIALQVAEKYPDVSVYHFDCPQFREGEGHVGTFGTLVRFLPMFEKELKTVWVSDIDVNTEPYNFSNRIVEVASNYDVFAENRVCYDRKPWNFGKKHAFVAYRMIFNITFPRRLLTHYINKLADGSLKQAIDQVNDYNTRKPRNERFPYGMDEYFINGVIYDYVKKHDLTCLFRKKYDLSGWFEHGLPIITKEDRDLVVKYELSVASRETLKRVKQIYKKGIQWFLEKDPIKYGCFRETLEKLDSLKDGLEEWVVISGKDL